MDGLQRKRVERWWLLCLVALICSGCATQSDPPTANRPSAVEATSPAATTKSASPAQANVAIPRVVIAPPGRDPIAVRVEVARTIPQRQRGLMFREQMDDDAGMVFLFEQPQQLAFWMHNTFIPLDMIFIRADMTVLGVVENAEPRTDDSRQVQGQSQYVLEVNAGFARKHGIGAGNLVKFEGIEGVGR